MPTKGLALVMSGGGARAAYQVGLLRFLARRHPELRIPYWTGVSAGAINATFMASHPGEFTEAVASLEALWTNIRTDRVMSVGSFHLLGRALRWGLSLVSGGSRAVRPARGLVNTTPLRRHIEASLRSELGPGGEILDIQRNIDAGKFEALGISTTSYSTGQSITWVQGRDVPMWTRPHRRSRACRMTVDHVLASAALPLFFPAVKIRDQWHGDGGIRLTAPLSPALHMGASRILCVSTRYRKSQEEADLLNIVTYPPPAQVIGVLLNAIFLDMIDFDAMNLERVNRLIEDRPESGLEGLRTVELFVMRPSIDLAKLASEFEVRLPGPFRFLTRGLGTRDTKSPDSLSLLLFEPEYTRRLIELGEQDAEERGEEIVAFIEGRRTEA